LLLFFKKEVLFFFEKKNQKTFIHLAPCGFNMVPLLSAGGLAQDLLRK